MDPDSILLKHLYKKKLTSKEQQSIVRNIFKLKNLFPINNFFNNSTAEKNISVRIKKKTLDPDTFSDFRLDTGTYGSVQY